MNNEILSAIRRSVSAIADNKTIDLLIDYKQVKRALEDLADMVSALHIDAVVKYDAIDDIELAAQAIDEMFHVGLESPAQSYSCKCRALRRLKRVFFAIKEAKDIDIEDELDAILA